MGNVTDQIVINKRHDIVRLYILVLHWSLLYYNMSSPVISPKHQVAVFGLLVRFSHKIGIKGYSLIFNQVCKLIKENGVISTIHTNRKKGYDYFGLEVLDITF